MTNERTKRIRAFGGAVLAAAAMLGAAAPSADAQTAGRIEFGLNWWGSISYGFYANPIPMLSLSMISKIGVGVVIETVQFAAVGIDLLWCSPDPRHVRPYVFAGGMLASGSAILQAGAGVKLNVTRGFGFDFGARYWTLPGWGGGVFLLTGGIAGGW
jgi:hypothetical protein